MRGEGLAGGGERCGRGGGRSKITSPLSSNPHQGEQDSGASVARAWSGRGAGMSCSPQAPAKCIYVFGAHVSSLSACPSRCTLKESKCSPTRYDVGGLEEGGGD
eukprot:gene17399-biopygen15902